MSNYKIFPYFVLILIVGFIIRYGFRLLGRSRSMGDQDGPILSSSEMQSSKGLQSLQTGKFGTFAYSLMVNNSGRVMVNVALGKSTNLHLIATGDGSKVSQVVIKSISKQWLKPLNLEGDFPNYFKVYVTPDKELEVLEMFNPSVMEDFVEFCRTYDFEIYEDNLFISQSKESVSDKTNSTLVGAVEVFLQKNTDLITKFLD